MKQWLILVIHIVTIQHLVLSLVCQNKVLKVKPVFDVEWLWHTSAWNQYRPICHHQSTLRNSIHDATNINDADQPKLDFNECYYDVLEVNPSVSAEELKKAYYKIVFKYHPDNKESEIDKELGNRQMMVINFAYKILKDPVSRREYDERRRYGLFGAKAGIKGSPTNHKPSPEVYSDDYTPNATSSSEASFSNDKFGRNASSKEKYSETVKTSKAKSVLEDNVSIPKTSSPAAAKFRKAIEQSSYSSTWYNQVKQKQEKSNDWTSILMDDDKMTDLLYSRGDGTVSSLKSLIERLKFEKDRLDRILKLDTRDWGEVTDINEVEKRLKLVEDVRLISKRLFELEQEMSDLISGRPGTHDSTRRPWNDDNYQRDRIEDDGNHDPIPQPQRVDPNNPRPPRVGYADSDGGRSWRRNYDTRRRL